MSGERGRYRITIDVEVDLDSWEVNYGTGETVEQVGDTVAEWAAELLAEQFKRSTIEATVRLR